MLGESKTLSNGGEEAKLDAVYTFRLPMSTKAMIDRLSIEDKADLNRRLRITVAKKLHEVNFDPAVYLNGEG